jgi:four helix bundle protein
MCSRDPEHLRFTIYDLRGFFPKNPYSPNPVTREEMKSRTKAYANRVVKLCAALPNNWIARTLGQQVLHSSTSVGVNYRAVCRAKSNADFINKLRVVEEECDESLFWMELLVDNNLIKPSRLTGLMKEADEILAIIVSSAKTARTSRSA